MEGDESCPVEAVEVEKHSYGRRPSTPSLATEEEDRAHGARFVRMITFGLMGMFGIVLVALLYILLVSAVRTDSALDLLMHEAHSSTDKSADFAEDALLRVSWLLAAKAVNSAKTSTESLLKVPIHECLRTEASIKDGRLANDPETLQQADYYADGWAAAWESGAMVRWRNHLTANNWLWGEGYFLTFYAFALANGKYLGIQQWEGVWYFNSNMHNNESAGLNRTWLRWPLDAERLTVDFSKEAVTCNKCPNEYDASARPWFKTAVTQGKLSWAGVYLGFSTGTLGQSATTPVYDTAGNLTGVLDCKYSLSSISDFLKNALPTPNAALFIYETDSLLLISLTNGTVFSGATMARINASECGDERIATAFEEIVAAGAVKDETWEAEVGGSSNQQLVSLIKIVDDYGIDWRLVVIIPKGDILGTIDAEHAALRESVLERFEEVDANVDSTVRDNWRAAVLAILIAMLFALLSYTVSTKLVITPLLQRQALIAFTQTGLGQPSVNLGTAGEAAEAGDTRAAVNAMMASKTFQQLNPNLNDPLDKRLNLIPKKAGAPPTLLISAAVLEELGRIPRSSEGFAEDAREILRRSPRSSTTGVVQCLFVFFSHRWLTPSRDPSRAHPDDKKGTKVSALIQWAKWFMIWRKKIDTLLVDTQASSWSTPPGASFPGKGFDGFDQGDVPTHVDLNNIWFWIDYACVDQDDPICGIQSLPLYISVCHAIVCYETPDYNERAWCRLERAVAYSYMNKGHRPFAIGPGFRSRCGQDAMLKRTQIDDPTHGKLTCDVDRDIVQDILQIAEKSCQFTLGAILRQSVRPTRKNQTALARVLDLIVTTLLFLGLPLLAMEPRHLVPGKSFIVRYELNSDEGASDRSCFNRWLAIRHWFWCRRLWLCLFFWVAFALSGIYFASGT